MSDAAGTAPDPDRVAGAVAAEVRRRRTRGDYDAALLQRIATDDDSRDGHDGVLLRMRSAAVVGSAQEAVSTRRLLAPLSVGTKRLVRRLIAWYVQPLATQQTAFNLMLLDRIALLERRVAALEPVWSRLDGMPPAESGAGDLTQLRADAVRNACAVAPEGAVLVGGPTAEQLVAAIQDVEREIVIASRVTRTLEVNEGAAYAVIVLAGVLPLLAAGDLLRLLPLTRERLLPAGLLLADTPSATPADAADLDPAHVRHISQGTLQALTEAAGLRVETIATWDELRPQWCMVRAARER